MRNAWVLIFALSGCAAPVRLIDAGTDSAVSAPPVGTEAEVSVGSAMLSSTTGVMHESFVIDEPPRDGWPSGVMVCAKKERDTLFCEPASTAGDRYQALRRGYRVEGGMLTGALSRRGSTVVYREDMKPTPVELASILACDGFRQELVYSGRDAGTLRITYREYSGDMVRPAFDQALSFDLSQPVIGFRSARIRIVEATNTSVRYVVEAGL